MELEQAQSKIWILSFHTFMPLVLTVFCNLFFKLTLAGLHVLTLNQSLYLSIFFLLRLLFWRIHPDHPRWTAGFFFFSLRTQRWTEECWGTLCLSVLVWHKRGSVCPTMHCSCLLFCLEGTRFLVAFKQFRAEAKYFPLWVPQGQPCPSLAICFFGLLRALLISLSPKKLFYHPSNTSQQKFTKPRSSCTICVLT